MDKVRVRLDNISEIVGVGDLGLLVLADTGGRRQLVIPCDKYMMYFIGLRMNGKTDTSRLLPEALCRIFDAASERLEVIISSVVNGEYRAMMVNQNTLDTVSVRASDGVLLSVACQVPLFVEARLMQTQSVPYRKDSKAMPLPVNVVSDEMLQAALDKAVSDENYELASRLRDELKRRRQKSQSPDQHEGK